MPGVVLLATAGYDHSIRFWEAPTGICYRTIQYPDSQVNRLAISADKGLIAVAGNPHVRVFDINSKSNSAVLSYEQHRTNVTAVGFQREGRWLYTGSEDGTIKLWDLRVQGCQRDYSCGCPVSSVTLHPNQVELLSGDENGRIILWDLISSGAGAEKSHFIPEEDVPIRSITMGSTGEHCIAANNKGRCFDYLMDPQDSAKMQLNHTFQAHSVYVLTCLLSPDADVLATTSADHTVKIWDASNGFKLYKTLIGHTRWVWDCAFSADSAYLVSGSSDHIARLWDLNSGETIRHYAGHNKVRNGFRLEIN